MKVARNEDELAEAATLGLVAPAQRTAIEIELDRVVGLLRRGGWTGWLDAAAGAPFNHRLLARPRQVDSHWSPTRQEPWPDHADG